jgi:MSHA biogenesis protein MshN
MLKDLDQRQVEQQGSSNFTVPVSSSSSNKKMIFLSLIVIVILNVAGLFVWQMYSENQALKISNTRENDQVVKQVIENRVVANERLEQATKNSGSTIAPNADDNKSINKNDMINVSNTIEKNEQGQNDLAKTITQNVRANEISVANTTNNIDMPVALTSSNVNGLNNPQESSKPLPEIVKKSTLKISRVQLTPRELAKQKISRAEQALANNDVSKAETLFEDVLLVMPEHTSARKQLAALWFGRQSYSDALNLLSQGVALSPNDSEFRVMKARIYLQQNQVKQAFITLNNMPNVNKLINVEYQSLRATIAQQLNEFVISAQAYQILVTIEPSAARWWLGLGVALDSNSEFEQASIAYQNALNKTGLSGSAEKFARQRIIELGE